MNPEMDQESYLVVRNDEEQYSIWPEHRDLPAGWRPTGFAGAKDACLAHIDEVWTDMRPLSLRQALAEAAKHAPEDSPTTPHPTPDLVTRLCAKEHPVDLVLRPHSSLERLRQAIELRYVHVRFPDTQGGTELGVALTDVDTTESDLRTGTGTMRLAGALTLDFEKLRCEATVDVTKLTGRATLRKL
jgi:uncharacterized protein YbdZ (MbtH family)